MRSASCSQTSTTVTAVISCLNRRLSSEGASTTGFTGSHHERNLVDLAHVWNASGMDDRLYGTSKKQLHKGYSLHFVNQKNKDFFPLGGTAALLQHSVLPPRMRDVQLGAQADGE